MSYSLQGIFELVGKNDKVSVLNFYEGSNAFNTYGESITVVFDYSQDERDKWEARLVAGEKEDGATGIVKARYLGIDLSEDLKRKLLEIGFDSNEILTLFPSPRPSENQYLSKGKRSMVKSNIKTVQEPRGEDIDWMCVFNRRMVEEGVGLPPQSMHFYYACKIYYVWDEITAEDRAKMYDADGNLKSEIEFEFLIIKYQREEITQDEKLKASELLQRHKRQCVAVLEKYLQDAGTSLKKLAQKDANLAVELISRVVDFKQRHLNVRGRIPIYLDLDSYLHTYLRHVEEFQVSSHFANKDNFQWFEDDVLSVLGKVVLAINDNAQAYWEKNPGKAYSRHGKDKVYFEGDYYTVQIDGTGRISTLHKNKPAINANRSA